MKAHVSYVGRLVSIRVFLYYYYPRGSMSVDCAIWLLSVFLDYKRFKLCVCEGTVYTHTQCVTLSHSASMA
jgi:hypothetical protein